LKYPSIEAYLQFCSQNRPQRGRPRDLSKLERELELIVKTLEDEKSMSRVTRLRLLNQKLQLENKLSDLRLTQEQKGKLEEDFLTELESFQEKHQIDLQAWKEMGVPKDVIRKIELMNKKG
jgi:tRNA A37 N6-isopentenylltransferase MiaA